MMLTAQGVLSHAEQYGQGGENVLLLHGWGPPVTLKAHLRPVAESLSDRYRVTALEFPGHGDSGKPDGCWGVAEFAQWTAEMMRRLDAAPATVVAHSFGGRIALYLAAHEPALVTRLVLTGCAGLREEPTRVQKRRAAAYRRGRQALEALRRLKVLRPLAEKSLEELRMRHGSADYRALDPDMRSTFVRIVGEDLRPLLSQVRQPTLLVWGERDDATPLWMGRVMEREIPDAALEVFEGRGHFAYLEELPRFVSIVRALIEEDGRA